MEHKHKKHYIRLIVWFMLTGFMLAGFGVASIVDTTGFSTVPPLEFDRAASGVLNDLERLGLLRNAPQAAVENLLSYQKKSGNSLVRILQDPYWQGELRLSSNRYKSTWYAANPYDLLPPDLQLAIRQKKLPMGSRGELERWCRDNKAPQFWVRALKTALRETTTTNLVRAAEGGKRPFARNGQILEPIVVETGNAQYEIHDGHIATDPRIIPTNTYVVIILKLNGKQRALRVKATDIGQAIRGKHVDLPIQFKRKSDVKRSPYITFPKEYIGNPSVLILTPRKVNPNQKA